MSNALNLVPFYKETNALLSESLKLWTSSQVPSEAVDALRYALACPTTAPKANIALIRQITRKTRRLLEELAKTADDDRAVFGVSVSQLKAAGSYLSVVDDLTFHATRNGAGARSWWANPMVNIAGIPKIARAFLWPAFFTLNDQGVVSDVLFDAADALMGVVCLFEDKGHKNTLLGFKLDDFTTGAAFLQTMQAALPTACETMADMKRAYAAPSLI